jgi:uncharacterized phage protein gp47/JayE
VDRQAVAAAGYHSDAVDWQAVADGLAAFEVEPKAYELGTKPTAYLLTYLLHGAESFLRN